MRQSNSSEGRTGLVRLAGEAAQVRLGGAQALARRAEQEQQHGRGRRRLPCRMLASSMPSMPGMLRSSTPMSKGAPAPAASCAQLEAS